MWDIWRYIIWYHVIASMLYFFFISFLWSVHPALPGFDAISYIITSQAFLCSKEVCLWWLTAGATVCAILQLQINWHLLSSSSSGSCHTAFNYSFLDISLLFFTIVTAVKHMIFAGCELHQNAFAFLTLKRLKLLFFAALVWQFKVFINCITENIWIFCLHSCNDCS